MKTNQLMQVRIGNYVQPIEHKTMMGSLTHLWEYGNSLRASKGLVGKDLNNWMRSIETLELVRALENRYANQDVNNMCQGHIIETLDSKEDFIPKAAEMDKDARGQEVVKSQFVRTKRGKSGGTWVHLMLLLDAAAFLDAGFKVQVYETFINNKILQWRDEGGDNFLSLNIAIDAYLPDRVGKDNKGVYIQCAIRLKEKLQPDGGAWNTASHLQLERRAKVEEQLVSLLRLGVVRDFTHLKELIDKV